MNADCSIIVLAAGRGTRMKSSLPKVLQPLCGRSLLSHALLTAAALSPKEVLAVVKHCKEQVEREALSTLPGVVIAEQDDVPGTGRAVECALEYAEERGLVLGDTIIVTSADVPLLETETLKQLLKQHLDNNALVTVVTTKAQDPAGYGRIVRNDQGNGLARIVEDADATSEQKKITEINAGIYAFDTKFLSASLRTLESNNAQGEIYLTDTVAAAAKQSGAFPFLLSDHWQAEGCNDFIQLAQLRTELNRRICNEHMLRGVRITDPATTSIDIQVSIEADAVIEPCTQIMGDSVIEAGAHVGPLVTLRSEHVGQGETINVATKSALQPKGEQ